MKKFLSLLLAAIMLLGCLPAMAEAAWTDKARKHFDDFLLRLKREMVYYDSKGINYYQYFSPEGQEEPAPTLNDVFKD